MADRAAVAAPTPAVPLTRRASLNVVAFAVDFSAKTAVGLVITPLLVDRLGTALYGTWEMLERLAGYVAAGAGRPADALRLLVANRHTVTDGATQRRTLGAALVVWLIFLPLAATSGAVLAWFAPHITGAASELYSTIRLSAALLFAAVTCGSLLAVPEAVLHGMNLGYRRMELQAAVNLVGGFFTAGAIWAGLGLAGVAGAQLALAAVSGLCFWWLARTYVTWFGAARPTTGEARSLVGLSAWLSGGDLIAKLLLASDVLILGALISPAAVATYVLTAYAPRAAVAIHGSAVGAAMPGLGGLIGERQYARAALVRRELMALTWLFATAVGATILMWNRSFVTLWVGGEHFGGPWVDFLIVLIAVQTVFIRADAYIIDAALRSWLRVVFSAVAVIVTITLAVLLTRALGIAGLCLGLLAGRLTQTVAYPLLAGRCVRSTCGATPAVLARAAVVTGLLFAGADYLGHQLVTSSWLVWGTGVAATLPFVAALAFAIGLSRTSRDAVQRRVAEVLRYPRAAR